MPRASPVAGNLDTNGSFVVGGRKVDKSVRRSSTMKLLTAGTIAGIAGGLVMTGIMLLERRAEMPYRTLAERSEDWLDRAADTRQKIGARGTTALEQANHVMASAGFGAGYGALRQQMPSVPAALLGVLYGAALYVINMVGIAPLLRITAGEQNAPAVVRAERAGLHLLFGLVTALIAEQLTRRSLNQ
jgi:hypothetical protein